MEKHEKKKKRVEIVLKLATNGQGDKDFLLTSTFIPKGLFAPALGLYTCIKVLKYIPGPGERLQDHWSSGLEHATSDQSDDLSASIKKLSPRVVSSCRGAIYMCV